MPAAGFVIRERQAALRMRTANHRDLMSAGNQCPGKLIGARAACSLGGGEMLMEVKEAHETRSVEG